MRLRRQRDAEKSPTAARSPAPPAASHCLASRRDYHEHRSVDGLGSKWTNSGEVDIGYAGGEAPNITNSGSVSSNGSSVGYASGSTGSVTVDGSGSTWTNSSSLNVGYSGNGSLSITGGAAVSNTYGTMRNSGSAGTVTVDGGQSKWINSNDLYIGSSGSGTLNITNGGTVSVVGATYVSSGTSSTGAVNFGANDGTLTTQSLYASSTQLTGTGTVNTRGLVSDIYLVFNSTHGLKQTTTLNSLTDQDVTLNLDMSTTANNGVLGAGYQGGLI